jgi:UDP-glucose 4-epimerase
MTHQDDTILVTGGAGFIGSELVRQLAERGDRVVVVDNLVNGKRENLDGVKGQVELVVADIRDAGRMAALLKETRKVYHLACLGVRHSIHSPQENHEVNTTATLSLLRLAREAGIGRFVCVSSSEVYGTAIEVPQTEDHPTYPMTVYGASKLAGEAYTRAYYRTYGYPTVVVRPFNTYGPRSHHEGDSGEVIPKFMLRAMAGKPLLVFGDGTQTRDFIYVSDAARGIIQCGEADDAIGQTINIGAGFEIAINELAREVAAVTGQQVQILHESARPGDTLRLYADISRARAVLGFSPRVSLHEGLKMLFDWYQQSGQSPEALLAQEIAHNWEIG